MIEANFYTTAHGSTVDGCKGRNLEVHDPLESSMSQRADLESRLFFHIRVNTHDIGAHVKNVRFSRENPSLYILVFFHSIDDLVERFKGLFTPGVRNIIELSVVHRDNCYLACFL